MKTMFLLLLVSFTIEQVIAQSSNNNDWFWQYPKPQGNTLRDVFVFDSLTAIAVGDLGTVIKTTDGGENWTVKHHVEGLDDLIDVFFLNKNEGWIAGGKIILETEDGGETWFVLKKDSLHSFSSVYFLNSDTGFVFGKHIMKTVDGGKNWNQCIIYTSDPPNLTKVTFADELTGWAVGYSFYGNTIYKTIDGGDTWFQLTNIKPVIYIPMDTYFIDKNIGWVVGEGNIIKTTDGGESWTYQENGDGIGVIYSVSFANTDTGWVVGGIGSGEGETGIVLITTDGGENWIESNSSITEDLYSLGFADGMGWSVGKDGAIYRTTDYGVNWNSQRDEKYNFSSIHFIDENTGWAVGDSGIILNTTDGGDNWERQHRSSDLKFTSVFALDANNVFSVGSEIKGKWPSYTHNPVMLHTINGGQNWTKQIFDTLGVFNSINFINDSVGWIAGTELFKTTDKGNTWDKISSNAIKPSWDIQFINENFGWGSVYRDTALLKTTDGGINWTYHSINSTFSMRSFYFANADIGWAAGIGHDPETYYWDRYIFKTSNGGDSWIQCINTPQSIYNSIQFINENTGWACGGYIHWPSSIIKTTDGGNNWFRQNSPAKNGLTNIYFLNENTGWAIGDGIFKTVNGGGIVSVRDGKEKSNYLPEKIGLFQNYPNPFNPVTIINYQLPINSLTTLKVYDILGREIITLVNEEQNAGEHKIEFNAAKYNLSSGVYFYRVSAGKAYKTKKMILLR